MPSFLLVVALFCCAFQDAKPEKPIETKEVLKSIIVDFDRTYRQCMKRYESARTTADQQDASNENFLDLDDWIRNKNETAIEFDCLFIDILRSDEHGFVANFSAPRLLLAFCPPSKKPFRAKPVITLPADSDLREVLVRGMKVTVKATIHAPELHETKNQIGQEFAIFHIAIERSTGVPRFCSLSSPTRGVDNFNYSTTFVLKQITITPDPDDLKKVAEKTKAGK